MLSLIFYNYIDFYFFDYASITRDKRDRYERINFKKV